MTTALFAITRSDGRSNAQVLLDYVKDGEPGRVYTFADLGSALDAGTDRRFTTSDVRNVVTAASRRLLREQQRVLHSVRRVGYRIAKASDHRQLALNRTRRADVQLKRGFLTLQHVRWDEMDPTSRKVHEGTLMVVGALYQQQRAMENRLSAVEDAIRGLTKK